MKVKIFIFLTNLTKQAMIDFELSTFIYQNGPNGNHFFFSKKTRIHSYCTQRNQNKQALLSCRIKEAGYKYRGRDCMERVRPFQLLFRSTYEWEPQRQEEVIVGNLILQIKEIIYNFRVS